MISSPSVFAQNSMAIQFGQIQNIPALQSSETAVDMKVDRRGNSYLLAQSGSGEIVVAGVDAKGQVTFTQTIGNSNLHVIASALELDNSGNLYVLGSVNGYLFGPAAGVDPFLVKMDTTNGAIISALQFGSQYTRTITADNARAIAIDQNRNVAVIVGDTSGSMLEPVGGYLDIFAIQVDLTTLRPTGNQVQLGMQTIGAPSQGSEGVTAVKFDGYGNAYLIGQTSADFAENFGGGYGDIIVVSLDALMQVEWKRQIGFTTARINGWDARGLDIPLALDIVGSEIYVVGSTRGSLFATNYRTQAEDSFAFAMDLKGQIQWAKQYGVMTLWLGALSRELLTDIQFNPQTKSLVALGIVQGSVFDTFAGPPIYAGYNTVMMEIDMQNGQLKSAFQHGQSSATAVFDPSHVHQGRVMELNSSGGISIFGTTYGNLIEPIFNGSDVYLLQVDMNGHF